MFPRRSPRLFAAAVVVALVASACVGPRPDLVAVDRGSGDTATGVGLVDQQRDPTGLSAGATELAAPELLESTPAPDVVDAETMIEGGPGPLPPTPEAEAEVDEGDGEAGDTDEIEVPDDAADDPADNGGEPDDGGDATDGEPDGPPITLAFLGDKLDRPALYEDPWPSILDATGRPVIPEEGRTTRGIAAETIRVGGLVAQTVVDRPNLVGVCEGAEARFARANASDELRRRIEAIDCRDDATQPDLSTGLARALVRDDVFAIVPLVSPAFLDSAWLHDNDVPYVGWGAQPVFCGRQTGYGVSVLGAAGCPVLDARGYTAVTAPVLTALAEAVPSARGGVRHVVEDSAAGDQQATIRKMEADLLGVEIDTLAVLPPASRGAPGSWRSIAAEIAVFAPGVVLLEADMIEGLPAALRAAGFNGEIAMVGHVDPLELDDPDEAEELGGVVVVSPGVDMAARSSRAWSQMVRDASLVGLAADDVGLGFVKGYLSADIFVRLVSATPEPLTAERIHTTVNDGWWYPGLGSVACGGWWPAGHLIDHPCVSIARVDAGTGSLVSLLGLRETAPQLRFRL